MRKKPIVLSNGRLEEMQSTDELDISSEMDLTEKVNGNAGSLVKGQPVYVNASGQIDLAKADAALTANVLGFVRDNTIGSNVSGQVQIEGQLNLTDWTAISGATDLTVNSEYFLDAANAGMISTNPPTTPGQYISFVGFAVDAKTLFIKWERSIRL